MPKVLVTGATGFIGSWCIIDLLRHGYEVRGTVRDLSRVASLAKSIERELASAQGTDVGRDLSFCEASLTASQGWREAMAGVDAVLHVASPVPIIRPRDPQEVIAPAVQGTMNVLQAAQSAGVHRVVMTSSVAAVGAGGGRSAEGRSAEGRGAEGRGAEGRSAEGRGADTGKNNNDNSKNSRRADVERHYDASDWSDADSAELSPYAASKTMAERAAWAFCEQHPGMQLTTINPALVLGPAIEADYGSSLETLVKLLKGQLPMVPKLGFEIVDVRDVAALHRIALEQPDAVGQRLLCAAGFRWFVDVSKRLADGVPAAYRRKLPRRELPNFLVLGAALLVKELRDFLPNIGKATHYDCAPAWALGWRPRSPEEAALSGAQSLIRFGVI